MFGNSILVTWTCANRGHQCVSEHFMLVIVSDDMDVFKFCNLKISFELNMDFSYLFLPLTCRSLL